jgi:hypothetical protein
MIAFIRLLVGHANGLRDGGEVSVKLLRRVTVTVDPAMSEIALPL